MFWRYIDFFSLKYNVHVNSIFLKIIDNKKKGVHKEMFME